MDRFELSHKNLNLVARDTTLFELIFEVSA